MKIFLLMLVGLCVSACTASSGVKNYHGKGNLEALNPAICSSIYQLSSNQTPADIFHGVKLCLESGDFSTASELYLAAMVYGYYDTLRVSDKTSHQGLTVLRMQAFSGVAEQKQPIVQAEIDDLFKDNKEVCSALINLGEPSYHPTYMIQHGIGAFTGDNSNNGLAKNFNGQASWNLALQKIAEC